MAKAPSETRKSLLPPLPVHEGQAARLRGVLRLALQEAMPVGFGVSLGVTAISCGGSALEPTGVVGGGEGGGGGTQAVSICEAAKPALGCDPRQPMPDFARFAPPKPVEYWARGQAEVHRDAGYPEPEVALRMLAVLESHLWA